MPQNFMKRAKANVMLSMSDDPVSRRVFSNAGLSIIGFTVTGQYNVQGKGVITRRKEIIVKNY